MICRHCKEYEEILAIQKDLIKTYLDIQLRFKDYAILNQEGEIECDTCGAVIHNGEYYLNEECIEEIKIDIRQQIAAEVEKNIEACEICEHGAFMQGLKHDIYNTFDEDDEDPEGMFESFNYSTDLGDLVNDISDWDESITDGVIEYISCPNCKAGSGENYEDKCDYGEWDEYTTVYTQQDIDEFNEAFYNEKATYKLIKNEIDNIAQVCTYKELIDLKNEYIKNPLLSTNISLKKIQDLVESLYNRNKAYIIDEFYVLYRARINKDNVIYSKDKMWEPPMSVVSHGRYNPVGFPVLYLANSKEVIKLEVKKETDEHYNIGSFKIKSQLNFFKINAVFSGKFEGFINEEVPVDTEKAAFKVQYIITNIMSLIIKQVGFNGVAYLSTKDSRYINFAVLEYERDKDIEILEVTQE